jgi:hypothetical protein
MADQPRLIFLPIIAAKRRRSSGGVFISPPGTVASWPESHAAGVTARQRRGQGDVYSKFSYAAAAMKLPLVLFALFCAFAAVLAPALGAGRAGDVHYAALSVVAATDGLACTVSGAEQSAPIFKPCGKLLNGMAVLCHADPGILPLAMAVPCAAATPPAIAVATIAQPGTRPLGHYRPPRSAARLS